MIAVDSNLLIYAHREDSEFHKASKELVDGLRHQSAPWAIPWPCVHEFIAIATHPGIYKPASTRSEALGFLDTLFAAPQLHLLSESPGCARSPPPHDRKARAFTTPASPRFVCTTACANFGQRIGISPPFLN